MRGGCPRYGEVTILAWPPAPGWVPPEGRGRSVRPVWGGSEGGESGKVSGVGGEEGDGEAEGGGRGWTGGQGTPGSHGRTGLYNWPSVSLLCPLPHRASPAGPSPVPRQEARPRACGECSNKRFISETKAYFFRQDCLRSYLMTSPWPGAQGRGSLWGCTGPLVRWVPTSSLSGSGHQSGGFS